MAMAPIEYRGYLIKPISHAVQPHFIKGQFVYWGYIPVYLTGPYPGAHAGPGATWSPTIGGVKTMIDCLHEAGPEPSRLPSVEAEVHRAWNTRFWALMNERRT